MIIVTGPSCSGKSTFGRVARASGVAVVETTDIVKAAFRQSGRPTEDIVDFCVRRYTEAGEEVFAALNYERLVTNGYDLQHLILVGFRAAGEVEYFRRVVPSVRVLGIYADTSVRFERGLIRDRADAAKTIAAFVRRDMREYAMGLAALLSRCLDDLIVNNSSLLEFEERVKNELRDSELVG